jgi:hypothetical protein
VIVVWKFPLAMTSKPQGIEMPALGLVRHVNSQVIGGRDCVVMWVEGDTDPPVVTRTFRIYATGEPIDLPVYSYIGSAHIDWTVWHVYEDKTP